MLPSHCRFSFFVYFPFGTCLFFPRTIKHRKQAILNIFNHKYDTCTTYQHNIKIIIFHFCESKDFLLETLACFSRRLVAINLMKPARWLFFRNIHFFLSKIFCFPLLCEIRVLVRLCRCGNPSPFLVASD